MIVIAARTTIWVVYWTLVGILGLDIIAFICVVIYLWRMPKL